VVLPPPPGAAGVGDHVLAGVDREVLHRDRQGCQPTAFVEVVTGHHRPAAGGVDQGGQHSAVEDAVVGAEVVAVGKLELHPIAIPADDSDAAVAVEGDALLPMTPEPGPPTLLLLLGQHQVGSLGRPSTRSPTTLRWISLEPP